MRGTEILKALPFGLGVPVLVLVGSVGPDDFFSNYVKWGDWLSRNGAPWLSASPMAIRITVWIIIAAFVLYALFVWPVPLIVRWARRHKRPLPVAATSVTDTPFTPMEEIFGKDFSDLLSFKKSIPIKIRDPKNGLDYSFEASFRLHFDFRSHSDFVSLFVPIFTDARVNSVEVLQVLRDHLIDAYRITKATARAGMKLPGESYIQAKDLIFSGRVFIYTLNFLSPVAIGQLVSSYHEKGLFLDIRGHDYWLAHQNPTGLPAAPPQASVPQSRPRRTSPQMSR